MFCLETPYICNIIVTVYLSCTRPDSRQEQEQGARLAGHFLSSPPDLHTRRGPRNHELGAELEDSDAQSDHYTSQATQVLLDSDSVVLP